MIRCTSVNKVRNGWGIEAAVLDYKLIYGQHSPLSNNQPVVVGNHNNESTMHICMGKTYKVNNNGWYDGAWMQASVWDTLFVDILIPGVQNFPIKVNSNEWYDGAFSREESKRFQKEGGLQMYWNCYSVCLLHVTSSNYVFCLHFELISCSARVFMLHDSVFYDSTWDR